MASQGVPFIGQGARFKPQQAAHFWRAAVLILLRGYVRSPILTLAASLAASNRLPGLLVLLVFSMGLFRKKKEVISFGSL